MDDRIKRIADHFGLEVQGRQLMEEMGELAQAVNKLWRFDKGYIDGNRRDLLGELAKEIADVTIMTGQITHLTNCSVLVDDIADRVLDKMVGEVEVKKEPEKMVTVIEGVHDISIDHDGKRYVWQVPDGLTVKIGDIVRVNTKRGQDNALVLDVCEMPLSEAEKHKAVVGVLNLGA